MIHNRTKIVATIGPATDTPDQIAELIAAGVNVFRINASHSKPKRIRSLTRRIRKVDRQLRAGVGILVDLQGPKIRVGPFERAEPIWLRAGKNLIISTEPGVVGCKAKQGDITRIGTRYEGLAADVKPRERILLDDGAIELRVVRVEGTEILTKVVYGGLLKQYKGINLPGSQVSTECITPEDEEGLEAALESGADYVALSFVRNHKDVERLKGLIADHGSDARVIAKIERPEAIDNLEKIVAASDALMVARGDLGVEMGAEKVPALQKRIIDLSIRAMKPVITATQMLESMIVNPRPTRAEASDVANAIYDGTSAVMLSAETASGKHPLRAVRMMDRIIRETERDMLSDAQIMRRRRDARPGASITLATVRSACTAAFEVEGRAIAVFSESGTTALAVASERPSTPIVTFTPFQSTVQRLALVWGVRAFRVSRTRTSSEMTLEGEGILREEGLVKPGQHFVVVVGSSRKKGLTNIMNIRTLEEDTPRRRGKSSGGGSSAKSAKGTAASNGRARSRVQARLDEDLESEVDAAEGA